MPITINLDIPLTTGKQTMAEYAGMVRKVELHLLDLKKELERIQELANVRKAQLLPHATGANKEAREAALAILLRDDVGYPQMADEITTIEWSISKYRIEQSYYERMFREAEHRSERITQAAALFKTFPGDLD